MAAGSLAGMTESNDLERLLCRQQGAVSRIQLRDIGLSVDTIESWVCRGRLRRLLRGVYCAGVPSLATRAHAAYLWQPRGVVSHLAAAHLWKMAVDEPRVVHLMVPLSCARASPEPWLRVFRRDTPRNRRSTVCGLPVTDVPRTVFDCLTLLDDTAGGMLLDHVTTTLTSQRALRMRYVEDIGLHGSPRPAPEFACVWGGLGTRAQVGAGSAISGPDRLPDQRTGPRLRRGLPGSRPAVDH
ncbi:MAG: hypothetical protein ACRDTG_19855 [Pseudonocardiaceae bacterium]